MRLTKQQFIDRFTPAEFVGLLSAAKVSTEIEAWLFRFNSLTPDADGTGVDTTDPRTVAGLYALEQAQLIGPGRANVILSNQSAVGGIEESMGISRGSFVRLLPPFDTLSAEPVLVESIGIAEDGNVFFVLAGLSGFARDYLEPVE
jgi:hypothetical protein